ncbi:tumor necrosis factor receptor superfamily member 19L isoform X2 [Coturnix japonica]|uniref:tumor necrosis factor receptor superfamily member 19L isoform X2 n=1 Tax=Coturnix japonica TaxID=93934 RepID=UPI0013A5BFE6|nr:tumor necrosis factor receptor superfamily member 19L isoform X2 [Coturnix japonica]
MGTALVSPPRHPYGGDRWPECLQSLGMHCWLLAVLGVLSSPCMGTTACELLRCPPGEEPIGACSTAQSCRPCPPGSSSAGDAPCVCMHGFYSPDGHREPQGLCLPCSAAPHGTPGCAGRRRARRVVAPQGPSGTNGTWEVQPEESAAAQLAVLAIVPVFCAMGLLGILVCNLLKKKGYYCTAHKEHEHSTSGPSSIYQIEDANEDTIGVLVRLITEKKENAAALEELLKEHQSTQPALAGCKPAYKLHLLPQFPPSCCHQQHLHTVHGPAPPSDPPCTRCSQRKWPQVLPPPTATKATRPAGEITILSIGRFRVSRIPEQKPGVGGDPFPTSTRPSWLKSTDSRPEGSPSAARFGDSTLAM